MATITDIVVRSAESGCSVNAAVVGCCQPERLKPIKRPVIFIRERTQQVDCRELAVCMDLKNAKSLARPGRFVFACLLGCFCQIPTVTTISG
jgi:hypothetical protein